MTKIKSKIKNHLKRIFRVIARPAFKEIIYEALEALEVENEILLKKTARLISTAQLHQKTFAKFRGCNKGKSVVIVGAGPSLDNFKPIENCLYVGLNSAVKYPKVKFDYLFAIDRVGINKVFDEFCNYDCVKFVGDQNNESVQQIPESKIAEMKGEVLRYKTDTNLFLEPQFSVDIDSEPLGNFNTVALQALQFVAYTNPQKIYLVGCDCSNLGHFGSHDTLWEYKKTLTSIGCDVDSWAKEAIGFWLSAKEFMNKYYPDIEIISVNPVGLRGLFTDLDQ